MFSATKLHLILEASIPREVRRDLLFTQGTENNYNGETDKKGLVDLLKEEYNDRNDSIWLKVSSMDCCFSDRHKYPKSFYGHLVDYNFTYLANYQSFTLLNDKNSTTSSNFSENFKKFQKTDKEFSDIREHLAYPFWQNRDMHNYGCANVTQTSSRPSIQGYEKMKELNNKTEINPQITVFVNSPSSIYSSRDLHREFQVRYQSSKDFLGPGHIFIYCWYVADDLFEWARYGLAHINERIIKQISLAHSFFALAKKSESKECEEKFDKQRLFPDEFYNSTLPDHHMPISSIQRVYCSSTENDCYAFKRMTMMNLLSNFTECIRETEEIKTNVTNEIKIAKLPDIKQRFICEFRRISEHRNFTIISAAIDKYISKNYGKESKEICMQHDKEITNILLGVFGLSVAVMALLLCSCVKIFFSAKRWNKCRKNGKKNSSNSSLLLSSKSLTSLNRFNLKNRHDENTTVTKPFTVLSPIDRDQDTQKIPLEFYGMGSDHNLKKNLENFNTNHGLDFSNLTNTNRSSDLGLGSSMTTFNIAPKNGNFENSKKIASISKFDFTEPKTLLTQKDHLENSNKTNENMLMNVQIPNIAMNPLQHLPAAISTDTKFTHFNNSDISGLYESRFESSQILPNNAYKKDEAERSVFFEEVPYQNQTFRGRSFSEQQVPEVAKNKSIGSPMVVQRLNGKEKGFGLLDSYLSE